MSQFAKGGGKEKVPLIIKELEQGKRDGRCKLISSPSFLFPSLLLGSERRWALSKEERKGPGEWEIYPFSKKNIRIKKKLHIQSNLFLN